MGVEGIITIILRGAFAITSIGYIAFLIYLAYKEEKRDTRE